MTAAPAAKPDLEERSGFYQCARPDCRGQMIDTPGLVTGEIGCRYLVCLLCSTELEVLPVQPTREELRALFRRRRR